ncbi:hypothetical protein A9P82_05370 [Arachidicoccus ginsenosidimutans]|uniref:HvfC/BufC N-terminal domain-containing protein n=1 Tax=Arachidicoccus sp. BS20 TaxID=1850526 RepID=UPI0007F13414|nr:putative DNA-binding domain-containing protein [Arachidicoccus sp. BS20]ANI88766.1 hypothetical protein A9P82_05370 [Arachidicoccus sp. BS20]
MQSLTNTFEQQSKLASYCRTGEYEILENVNEKNVSQYRRLVFNVVDDMLQTAYPLTFELLTKDEWTNITKEFFANHACISPQVWSMPKEFYEYLSAGENHFLIKKYPFILELLWFEWLEVEMFMMEDKAVDYSIDGNIENDLLVINPEVHLQHFHYPVHLKNAKEISEDDKRNYFLSLHREPESGEVIFTSLSPALLRVLELLLEEPMSANAVAASICKEMNFERNNEIDAMLLQFVQNALETKLILGFLVR